MDKLVIPIAAVGGGVQIDATVPFSEIAPEDAAPMPLQQITLTGDISPAGDDFLVNGALTGEFVQACDRCLKEMRMTFTSDVFWTFEEGPVLTDIERMTRDDENLGSIWTFQGLKLDLRLAVYDECVLAAPSKFVCSEDCAGLCPVCGQAVVDHERPCEGAAREEDVANNAFAGLAEMFPDLAPKETEE